MANDDQSHRYQTSPPLRNWEHIYPHSHHGTPAQEYSGFNFSSPQIPMEPSAFSSSIQQRPMYQQLQPLVMPQWPSMLSSQSHQPFQPIFPQPIQPIQPVTIGALQTPVSAVSSKSSSTPRKTLTDLDRKRMCQYAEDNPNSKQTEIGAIFGVERSTVSKVLRQKEKYLCQDDGSRSPVKRAKGRSPDIERALAVWAKNQERKGMPLTDEVIREKARAFASTSSTPESHHVVSSSWIEKFKLKNNLMGARSRKGSLAPDDADVLSATASSSHTPCGTSPVSPQGVGSPSPVDLHSTRSQESLRNDSPGGYLDFSGRHGPFHSQSATSLNSAFTDTAPSSFSPGPLSPTSPFFTPDSGTAPSPFIQQPPLTARPVLPATTRNSNNQRPRSQTFPLMDQYASADAATPTYISATVLDSPMEEAPDPIASIDGTVRSARHEERPSTTTPAETMRPPPLPAHVLEIRRELTPSTSNSSLRATTSPEEALRALEVVHSFFEQQPNGFLDFQESVTMGKLMEKLKLRSRASSGL
ncbi:hypothetical protein BAUCODRAFT_144230 [Baudoinia panamericana UAMH 10762]|uniref:HTH CENPB-type domain-containing protein n=1 Tax=Baudoinia panamericana (strain UAMH 10762) TaxID=717646 RepID=M2M0P6_BAUPA|nr:uncharacterized protein BAUCODRAFT_144230 [Baudoinia panamericana UAMH 10762]EMD00578.1 hypothetical protein BAUCODRAFT_144230 [Baudoinia panamericana UAMH 10762]